MLIKVSAKNLNYPTWQQLIVLNLVAVAAKRYCNNCHVLQRNISVNTKTLMHVPGVTFERRDVADQLGSFWFGCACLTSINLP